MKPRIFRPKYSINFKCSVNLDNGARIEIEEFGIGLRFTLCTGPTSDCTARDRHALMAALDTINSYCKIGPRITLMCDTRLA